MTADLITKPANKLIRCRIAGQREDSHLRQNEARTVDFITLLRRAHNLKLINCLFLHIFT